MKAWMIFNGCPLHVVGLIERHGLSQDDPGGQKGIPGGCPKQGGQVRVVYKPQIQDNFIIFLWWVAQSNSSAYLCLDDA